MGAGWIDACDIGPSPARSAAPAMRSGCACVPARGGAARQASGHHGRRPHRCARSPACAGSCCCCCCWLLALQLGWLPQSTFQSDLRLAPSAPPVSCPVAGLVSLLAAKAFGADSVAITDLKEWNLQLAKQACREGVCHSGGLACLYADAGPLPPCPLLLHLLPAAGRRRHAANIYTGVARGCSGSSAAGGGGA